MGVFEFDFEVVAQVFAALSTVAGRAATPAAAEEVAKAKQITEVVAEIGEGTRIEARSTRHTLVAIAVVRPLF